MGLPGSGKTTLAARLARKLRAVHFNADKVRETINRDLGFTLEDRIEHSRRLGWMTQFVSDSGVICVADFVCPTRATREAFRADFTIWMNTAQPCRFPDTAKLFELPTTADVTIPDFGAYDDAIIGAIDAWQLRSRR